MVLCVRAWFIGVDHAVTSFMDQGFCLIDHDDDIKSAFISDAGTQVAQRT